MDLVTGGAAGDEPPQFAQAPEVPPSQWSSTPAQTKGVVTRTGLTGMLPACWGLPAVPPSIVKEEVMT